MLLLILCHGPCLGSIESKAVCTTPHRTAQQGVDMNSQNNTRRWAQVALTALATAAVCSAHAQRGVLEIHGVLTSPSCLVGVQSLQRWQGQTQVSGQACGLSTGAGNALSTAAIAHISEERQAVPHSTADAKRLFTLSYR